MAGPALSFGDTIRTIGADYKMPRIIYFNGSLAITSFNAEFNFGGNHWALANRLDVNEEYRFAIHVLNNSGNPANIDITRLTLSDLLSPKNAFPVFGPLLSLPHGVPILYSNIIIDIRTRGPGQAYHFYEGQGFTTWQLSGHCEFDGPLARGHSAVLYVYFKWVAPPMWISPSLPGPFVPQVSMSATELRAAKLGGPIANLQPNT
jgi:hypothetical protein